MKYRGVYGITKLINAIGSELDLLSPQAREVRDAALELLETARRHEQEFADQRDQELEEETHADVLCGCGWGRLHIPVVDIPDNCPICARPLRGDED